MKIAIVHDYLHTYGGAERVLEAIQEIYPDAPIFTAVYYSEKFPKYYKNYNIKTSFLQKFPKKFIKLYKALYPLAFKSFNLSDYDLIISSTAGMAKGVKKNPTATHISYIHTVPRAVVNMDNRKGLLNKITSHFYKKWDLKAAKNVDFFIANSNTVKDRVHTFYNKDAIVLNPPVEIKKLHTLVDLHAKKSNDYFVMVGRLEKYKGVVEVAQAMNELGYKLKVIGDGPERENIQSIGPNIEALGFISDEKKAQLLYNAKALVFWAFEDFGITMVESIALGTPVIAFEKGGSTEILNTENSVFFKEQTVTSLKQAISEFDQKNFDQQKIIRSSLKYSKENFKENLLDIVSNFTKTKKWTRLIWI